MTSESYEGAPIIHLFGAPSPLVDRSGGEAPTPFVDRSGGEADAEWKRRAAHAVGVTAAPVEVEPEMAIDRESLTTAASDSLVKKLSRKQLSSKEAYAFVLDFLTDPDAETPLDRYKAQEIADQIVVEFEQRLYLNDAGLAEVLVETLQSRKAVGRSVLARELTMRGIPREIIDEALGSLDRDEEAERALEFARDRARKLGNNVDEEAALRRLYGQLARRGYPGNIAQTAARTALRELRGAPGSARGRVTFS